MSWLGIWHQDAQIFDPQGVQPIRAEYARTGADGDALLVQGSLVIELVLPPISQAEPLLHFAQNGEWPVQLTLWARPDGSIAFQLDQYGSFHTQVLPPFKSDDNEGLRLTFSWDAPRFSGRLVAEPVGGGKAVVQRFHAPRPWRLMDLGLLFDESGLCYRAPEITMMALSDRVEPIGPMPGLTPETLIETARGQRALSEVQRGDLVWTQTGEQVPVLHLVSRQVPAFGSFAPIHLRSPGFGLTADLVMAPHQRVVLTGSDVEYLFGAEAVFASAKALTGSQNARAYQTATPLISYRQMILPGHEAPVTAGIGVESLFLGRLRRDRPTLEASLLCAFDRNSLPEHAAPKYPQLRAFDAAVLADRRIA